MPKEKFSSDNWYDVWFPNLAPSVETMKLGQGATTPAQWTTFTSCYCGDERHCHRSVLKQLLIGHGAKVDS